MSVHVRGQSDLSKVQSEAWWQLEAWGEVGGRYPEEMAEPHGEMGAELIEKCGPGEI